MPFNLNRFRRHLLAQYLKIDNDGQIVFKDEATLRRYLSEAAEEEIEHDDYMEQTIKGFKRKMPVTTHVIKCKVCEEEVEVRAIGKRKPRSICYKKACNRKNNAIKVKKHRDKKDANRRDEIA